VPRFVIWNDILIYNVSNHLRLEAILILSQEDHKEQTHLDSTSRVWCTNHIQNIAKYIIYY
jgi:hypothetical protein